MVKRFDKILREGKEEGSTFDADELVYVEEKIDGANMRAWIDDEGSLRFGSKNVEFTEDTMQKSFKPAIDYLTQHKDLFKFGYVYYFEAMIKHTIAYDFDKYPKAILIDIYDVEFDRYLNHEMIGLFIDNRFMQAPVIFEGKYKDFMHNIPKSRYYDGVAEGYVIKPMEFSRDGRGKVHRAKVVAPTFREEKTIKWSSRESGEEKLVEKYCTKARIEKVILKLEVAKDMKRDISWTPIVAYNVMYDICTEEFKKLVKIKKPDMIQIKKMIEVKVKNEL